MSRPVHVAWLRIGDLRLRDNPALWHASQAGSAVLPTFIWCPEEDRRHTSFEQAEKGQRDWSYEGTTLQAILGITLKELDQRLHGQYGNRLRIVNETAAEKGAAQALVDIAIEVGAVEIHYNRREEPVERRREDALERLCHKAGIRLKRHSAFLFRDPERCPIFQAVGNGLHVFKAFWDGWHKGGQIRQALPAPDKCNAALKERTTSPFHGIVDAEWPFGATVPSSRVTGRPLTEDMKELAKQWDLSEEGAHQALADFQDIDGGLTRYKGSITRDSGPKAKESRLSPFFRLGVLSMVEVWWQTDRQSDQGRKWLRRCAWRDYAYWMLHHWPDLPEVSMRPAFDNLEWAASGKDSTVVAWQHGRTGYPLVDAAMREMLQTGYLQQNMRHTVGQFLVEALGADWRDGEEWFHLALADSDLAINSMMWQHQGLSGVSQWLIGIDCHPVRHAKSADPQGHYVRRWVPELAKLPREYLHCPWEAPAAVLSKAGVVLGSSYPQRIVADVDEARASFLERAIRCREEAPVSCFSGDGCDLLTNPKTSGLAMKGIRALTEKSLRGAPSGRKGKGKDGKGKQNAGGKGTSHGQERRGGKGNDSSSRIVYMSDPDSHAYPSDARSWRKGKWEDQAYSQPSMAQKRRWNLRHRADH